ncbi:hypothetical protein H5410_006922 [Solanum commersonii]|uniref:Uncharacterized protein n=1 Tax=Solanum commersonii TaxID=4109 RepID=A0A9J6AB40_SOLCO|nr:hypothetical protein H5410_006922 [Solanum commersonii]
MAMGTHIPEEEILMDILTKLHAATYLNIFSEPYFKKKHLNHAKNQPDSQKLLIGASSSSKTDFNFYCTSLSPNRLLVNDIHKVFWPSISEPFSGCKVYCCCDALFLIEIWTELSWDEPSMILLWNPTTLESVVLSLLESSLEQKYTYGLGYDSTSDN